MTKFNSIELLFDLPEKIHNMDRRIETWAKFSYDEDIPCETVFHKILKAKQVRNKMKQRFAIMAKEFNSFDKTLRNCIGAIFTKNQSIKAVAEMSDIPLRKMYRLLDDANQKLYDVQYEIEDRIDYEKVI